MDRPMEPLIAAVVAPNGLGHLARTIDVLSRVHELRPSRFAVVCEDWQISALQTTADEGSLFDGPAKAITGIMAPGVEWGLDRSELNEERLFGWERRLSAVPEFAEADIVVSDNLVGVLSLRRDAVIMGSFLWPEVFGSAYPDLPAVRRFIDRDTRLLAEHQPVILSVGEIRTPLAAAQPNAIALPWMTDPSMESRRRIRDEAHPLIGVLPGTTTNCTDISVAAIRVLLESGDWRITAPDYLVKHLEQDERMAISPFRHRQEDFDRLDVALCRPGLGTVTACIRARVPMALLFDRANYEIGRTAARLEELCVAINVTGPDGLLDPVRLEILKGPVERQHLVHALEQRPTGGIDAAARSLLTHLC